MKRIFLLTIIILFIFEINAQSLRFVWLTDTHIGSPDAETDLSELVSDINKQDNISFTVITGDITEKGKNEELEKAKSIFDKLSVKYKIIAGNHDTKWSESGGIKFSELWGSDRFIFESGGIIHAGLSSGILWRGGGGHFRPEDLKWLEDTLSVLKPRKLFFYTHHPLTGETDNWFELTNIISRFNAEFIFFGHGHRNSALDINGIPAVMGRSSLSGNGSPGYTLVEVRDDSVLFAEINPGNAGVVWHSASIGKVNYTHVDSARFENFTGRKVISKDLGVTVSAPLVAADGRIFISTYENGIICVDYNGNELWKYYSNGRILSAPVFSEGVLISGTAEGDLIALEAHTGEVIQVIGLGEPVTSQLIVTDLLIGKEKIRGVIVGTASGNLYCYDIYNFELIWENSSASAMIETKPMYTAGKIIYGSWDNYLYCVNAVSGVLLWKWTENKNFYYSPAAFTPVTDSRNIYVATPDKMIHAVDLLLGTTVWKNKNYEAWETISISENKEQLYVKGMNSNFYIVSAADGTLIKKLEMDYGIDTTPSPPVESGGKLFFGSKNGILYSIDLENFLWERELFNGTSRIHSVIVPGNGRIA